jgi:hypothetical protein
MFGTTGKEFLRIHELACSWENTLYATGLLNWRVPQLTLYPVAIGQPARCGENLLR